MSHQQINSDALEGAIRNPIQRKEVVGRALRGSVCSLPIARALTDLHLSIDERAEQLCNHGFQNTSLKVEAMG